MKVLVTGAGGFVGQHLVEELKRKEHQVFAGLHRNIPNSPMNQNEFRLDILDAASVKGVIEEIKPDCIIHLAAISNVPFSWKNPSLTFQVNTIGTINLINAVIQITPLTKFISIGSSEEYGMAAKKYYSLREETDCLPQNPYAASKLAAGQVALQLALKYHLNVIHARPFNHFGPGQQKGFVISDFASQIAEIEAGLREPKMYVGNLTAWRDFTDVRDILAAYILLLEHDVAPGIYNISSGQPREVKQILNDLLAESTKEIEIIVDSEKYRANEVEKFVGDSSKICSTLHWSVNQVLKKSLWETLDWWRGHVKKPAH